MERFITQLNEISDSNIFFWSNWNRSYRMMKEYSNVIFMSNSCSRVLRYRSWHSLSMNFELYSSGFSNRSDLSSLNYFLSQKIRIQGNKQKHISLSIRNLIEICQFLKDSRCQFCQQLSNSINNDDCLSLGAHPFLIQRIDVFIETKYFHGQINVALTF